MLIDITIKTTKNKCLFSFGRRILEGKITIREPGGNEIDEIMVDNGFGFSGMPSSKVVKVSSLTKINLSSFFYSFGVSWRRIVDDFLLLEIILALAFKDRGADEEFDLTFQNIYYDPNTRLLKKISSFNSAVVEGVILEPWN
jgi:hypothetical protein